LIGSRLLSRAAVVAGVTAMGVLPAAAAADDPRRERGTHAKVMVPDGGYLAHSGHQHGDNMGQLEPARENVKLQAGADRLVRDPGGA
jgi:hypothetical protein